MRITADVRAAGDAADASVAADAVSVDATEAGLAEMAAKFRASGGEIYLKPGESGASS